MFISHCLNFMSNAFPHFYTVNRFKESDTLFLFCPSKNVTNPLNILICQPQRLFQIVNWSENFFWTVRWKIVWKVLKFYWTGSLKVLEFFSWAMWIQWKNINLLHIQDGCKFYIKNTKITMHCSVISSFFQCLKVVTPLELIYYSCSVFMT